MKCSKCNKSIKMTSFECKCKLFFCLKCLPSYEHNCTFNYKEHKRNILKQEIVEVKREKITVI